MLARLRLASGRRMLARLRLASGPAGGARVNYRARPRSRQIPRLLPLGSFRRRVASLLLFKQSSTSRRGLPRFIAEGCHSSTKALVAERFARRDLGAASSEQAAGVGEFVATVV